MGMASSATLDSKIAKLGKTLHSVSAALSENRKLQNTPVVQSDARAKTLIEPAISLL